MPIPKPKDGETFNDFLKRCMLDDVMISEYPQEQRAAICGNTYETNLAAEKISFDYDDTFSTQKGFDKAAELIKNGSNIYIISARDSKDRMIERAAKLDIPESKIFATGSNDAKIQKVKELRIKKHYDNNPDVIDQLGSIGILFK